MPKNSDTLERLFKEMVSTKLEVESSCIDRFFELYRIGLSDPKKLHLIYPRGCFKTPFTSRVLINGKIGYGYMIDQLLFDEYAFLHPKNYSMEDDSSEYLKVFTKYPNVISGYKVYLDILNPDNDSDYVSCKIKIDYNQDNQNKRKFSIPSHLNRNIIDEYKVNVDNLYLEYNHEELSEMIKDKVIAITKYEK